MVEPVEICVAVEGGTVRGHVSVIMERVRYDNVCGRFIIIVVIII